jgi:hypothetical protein
VGQELLQRPFYSDRVMSALSLTADEQEDMLVRLGSRDLAAEVEDSTLMHLLLRADSINRRQLDWRKLRVERILPLHVPEGSLWRKKKLLLPRLGDGDSEGEGDGGHSRWTGAASGGSGGPRRGSKRNGGVVRSSTITSSRDGSSGAGGSRGGSSDTGDGASSKSSSSSSSADVPPGMREVKYWFEVQRSHWRNRLGNLVLLQPAAQVRPERQALMRDVR